MPEAARRLLERLADAFQTPDKTHRMSQERDTLGLQACWAVGSRVNPVEMGGATDLWAVLRGGRFFHVNCVKRR